jgi:1-acyl-sn-glycerol-3-phosphate acyltransferase
MLERLNHAWRVVATGIAFAAFGVGGVVLRFVVFPILGAVVWDRQRRIRLARLTVHYSFKAFIELMRVLGLLRYEVRGGERLARPGLIVVANHPTLIDVVFLISLVRDADCVVKAGLLRNPFVRGVVRATGYVCNDSGPGVIDDCVASVRSGSSLIIFPEGTRTPLSGAMTLQRGAANVAVRAGRPLTPVRVRCEPRSLAKGEPWWRVPPRPLSFQFLVEDDIDVDVFVSAAGGQAPVAARHLTSHLHDYFASEASAHAGA